MENERNSLPESKSNESVDDYKPTDPLVNVLRPIVSQNPSQLPKAIKRYRVSRILGAGAFGEVYLAFDDQLQRNVAIKVPKQEFLTDNLKASEYISEAQMIAGLDHPNIVPVYDVGSTYDYPCFIVTKFIDGRSLRETQRKRPLSVLGSIELVSTVAKALHFAHRQGVVHRDIKPANILIEKTGKPFVVDLGLAIKGPRRRKTGLAGTPAYMSPEQARGEGHRVDGRSDIFSLGVVLFELLTGHHPFFGETTVELLENIAGHDPKPLRQIDDSFPRELERICMKAIAHRASERYTTAIDFASELESFVCDCDESWFTTARKEFAKRVGNDSSRSSGFRRISTLRSSRPSNPDMIEPDDFDSIAVVPKGIRSFDSHDSDFYPSLLPGPYDKDNLPESIRFWKSRIEDKEFSSDCPVGVLYGPSGCGKSSLVRAGILPRLNSQVVVIHIEATSDTTESDLRVALDRQFDQIDQDLDLASAFKDLRENHFENSRKKVLIVLDQFEQWLNGNQRNSQTLIDALRQCDGENVQCLLLVRDDFWLSMSRFARDLETKLSAGKNLYSMDLFSSEHALKVLHLFGHSYDAFPELAEPLSKGNSKFLEEIIERVSDDNRVSCVQLAIISMILGDREWNSHALENLGGIHGVGVAYLKKMFGSSNLPENRKHTDSAKKLLAALLPNDESDLKGARVSADRIQIISGYEDRDTDFGELIQFLESKSQLISAIDDPSNSETNVYQITHDYLIPAIKKWIEDSNRSSVAGRTRILLEQRTAVWNANPNRQRLPSPIETLRIAWYCPAKTNTPIQNQMLAKAQRVLLGRAGKVLVIIATIALGALFFVFNAEYKSQQLLKSQRVKQAKSLIRALDLTPYSGIPHITNKLKGYEFEAVPLLARRLKETENADLKIVYLSVLANLDPQSHSKLAGLLPEVEDSQLVLLAQPLVNSESRAALEEIEFVFRKTDSDRLKATSALLALDMGNRVLCQDVFAIDDNPNDRSHAITRFRLWDHNWIEIADCISETDDPGLLSGLFLACSQFDQEQIPELNRNGIIHDATMTYQHHPSSVVHSAARTLLKSWNRPIPNANFEVADATWRKTPYGMTLIKVPIQAWNADGLFHIEIRGVNKELYRVNNDFWISDQEVNGRMFLEFMNDADYPDYQKPGNWKRYEDLWLNVPAVVLNNEDYRRAITRPRESTWSTPDHPIRYVNMQDAIMFCNWLSSKENRQPAYKLTGETQASHYAKEGEPDEYLVWRLDPESNGYRLPAMSQWQYARLAGAKTNFGFGDDLEMVSFFGVWSPPMFQQRTAEFQACCSKFPNNLGIFDIFGNVAETCHAMVVPKKMDPKTGQRVNDLETPRWMYYLDCIIMDTTWSDIATHSDLISFETNGHSLMHRNMHQGFRVVLPVTAFKSEEAND